MSQCPIIANNHLSHKRFTGIVLKLGRAYQWENRAYQWENCLMRQTAHADAVTGLPWFTQNG